MKPVANKTKTNPMKTKIAGTIVAVMLLFSVKANTAEGDPYGSSIYSLRAKIRNTVSELVVSISNKTDAETYAVRFQVNEDNRLVITSIDGEDQYVIMQIRKKLQDMKAEGVFDHTNEYTVKIVFKQKDN
jgi:hypothetical protein